MLTIRLQRTGKRNQADFRIVIAEKEAPVNKKILEILGSYNPRKKVFVVKNDERLKYWISQNVQISPTVHNLFVTNKVLEGGKVKSFTIPKKEAAKEEAKPAAAAEAPKAETQPVAEVVSSSASDSAKATSDLQEATADKPATVEEKKE
jgi:small subunit ribosomal protein S16